MLFLKGLEKISKIFSDFGTIIALYFKGENKE